MNNSETNRNNAHKFTCDKCGQKFEIFTEPHAGVRDYFTCSCGEKYWIERGLIINIRKISTIKGV